MRFLIIFLAALAVANAATVGEPAASGRLTKWFSWRVPMFAPIRTTPKPMKEDSSEISEESAEAPNDSGFLRKLTKWFGNWGAPSFAPIRTTPKPMKEGSESVESIEEPNWHVGPFDANHPFYHHEVSSAEAVQALDELYNMDNLKDILPPMDSLFEGHPIEEHPDRPAPELDNPHIAELIQSLMDFLQRPHGSNHVEPAPDSNSSEQ